jgi:site-specific DNA recombinase
MSMNAPRLRCAVYTRKSTEEGLEQEFNSLDAQREACVSYIASQAGVSWKLVLDQYDDGGISGGTMERPALQRLLQDIRDKRVDVVVVYKIDRLTRSLMDFSKIVEVFDGHGASFVAVTQQFNTTTSMGRLTLNVLLSFAQFEREVTAERIRDKIAASKKKGMWMGGVVPLGYQVRDRKLIIEEAEAAIVRHLFDLYLELRSVRALVEEAEASGLRGRMTKGSVATVIGKPFGRGNLYHLLSNPIYLGKIRHHDKIYDGEHPPIIDVEVFARAQALLAEQAPSRSSPDNQPDSHLLTGLIYDETGDRLSPAHANKNGKRYLYYVSNRLVKARKKDGEGWRVPATVLDAIVERQLNHILNDQAQLAGWIQESGHSDRIDATLARIGPSAETDRQLAAPERRVHLRSAFDRIDLSRNTIALRVNRTAIVKSLLEVASASQFSVVLSPLTISVPIDIKRRGVETRIILLDGRALSHRPDAALVQLIARAQTYLAKLTDASSRSLTEIAVECRTELSEVSRILPLAFLAPSIVDAIMTGRQSTSLTAQRLLRLSDLPNLWRDQADILN